MKDYKPTNVTDDFGNLVQVTPPYLPIFIESVLCVNWQLDRSIDRFHSPNLHSNQPKIHSKVLTDTRDIERYLSRDISGLISPDALEHSDFSPNRSSFADDLPLAWRAIWVQVVETTLIRYTSHYGGIRNRMEEVCASDRLPPCSHDIHRYCDCSVM